MACGCGLKMIGGKSNVSANANRRNRSKNSKRNVKKSYVRVASEGTKHKNAVMKAETDRALKKARKIRENIVGLYKEAKEEYKRYKRVAEKFQLEKKEALNNRNDVKLVKLEKKFLSEKNDIEKEKIKLRKQLKKNEREMKDVLEGLSIKERKAFMSSVMKKLQSNIGRKGESSIHHGLVRYFVDSGKIRKEARSLANNTGKELKTMGNVERRKRFVNRRIELVKKLRNEGVGKEERKKHI